jgi:hypothetical protein
MKTYLLLVLILVKFNLAFAQEIKFEEVIQVDSALSKSSLFKVGKLWLNDTYKSGKDVIQMEDENAGIILGKAVIKYTPTFYSASVPATGYINYTIKLSFKNGRYKYEIYDFIHEGSTNEYGQNGSLGLINDGEKYLGNSSVFSKGYRDKVNEDTQKRIKSQIPLIISSLKAFLVDPKNAINGKDDW